MTPVKDKATELVKPTSATPFYVTGEVTESNQAWQLRISKAEGRVNGSRRLRRAIEMLILGNSLWARKIANGQSIDLEILKQGTQGIYRRQDLIKPLLLPVSIEDSLYPFQRSGVAWLLRNERAILADDMGLGKTAQAISGVRRLFRHGLIHSCLVVAPSTLNMNWIREAGIWAPELITVGLNPSHSERDEQWSSTMKRAHIVVTSYEQIRNTIEIFGESPPDIIIADEAHRLRNSSSQSTKGLRAIKSKRFWALSGTPLENSPEDIATLLSLLFPKKFSSLNKNDRLSTLRASLSPALLRRTKEQVLGDLPDVIERTEMLSLAGKQSAAYESVKKEFRLNPKESALSSFQRLLTICDHVDGESAKLDRIVEILAEIALKGEKAVVFSYTLEPLRLLEKMLTQTDPQINSILFSGELSAKDRDVAIQKFKNGSSSHVLLASSKIASEGLTLTEANHVLFVNRWWNPSSNQQARDRVVRIGQERIVEVRNFVISGTVEERVSELLEAKELTFDELIVALENDLKNLS